MCSADGVQDFGDGEGVSEEGEGIMGMKDSESVSQELKFLDFGLNGLYDALQLPNRRT